MAATGQGNSITADRLVGLRTLLVEDEALVSMLLEDDLTAAGCVVVGPFRRLAQAIEGARSNAFDFALLDINLAGEMVYPLADDLLARRIPVLFLSGYAAADLPKRFLPVTRVSKPYVLATLLRAMRETLAMNGK